MKNSIPFFAVLVVAIFAFSSCSSDPKPVKETEVIKEAVEESKGILSDKERLDRAKQIYVLIPSPLETSIILRDAGVSYDFEKLNDVDNVFNYQTTLAQALNLGIYGTDLSFSSAYGKDSEVFTYYTAVKVLSDALNISSAFNEENLNSIEENVTNHETLMQLISDSYWSANNELASHERAPISNLLIAGGWIEAMYIAIKIGSSGDGTINEQIIEKIGEQKQSLEYLMELLEDTQDNSHIKKIIKDFRELNTIYEKLEYTGDLEEINDPVTGELKRTLKKVILPKSDLAKISAKVVKMRTSFVSYQ